MLPPTFFFNCYLIITMLNYFKTIVLFSKVCTNIHDMKYLQVIFHDNLQICSYLRTRFPVIFKYVSSYSEFVFADLPLTLFFFEQKMTGTISMTGEAFVPLLTRIDECISYMERNVSNLLKVNMFLRKVVFVLFRLDRF